MAMVQYGLWPNCTNDCDFCLLLDRQYKSEEERLYILDNIKENIKVVDWKNKFSNGISLLGGEIFYTESKKVKESFLELIKLIISDILIIDNAVLSVVSNGIYDSKVLLEPVLNLLIENNVLHKLNLNFSWDYKGRFHSDKSLNLMIENVNMVYNKYNIIPYVQTCLTQQLIDLHLNGEFNIFDYQNKYFPNTILCFLYPHKINTGKKVSDFFFTRESLFKFIKYLKSINQNEIIQRFIQSVINSSQFKYTGIWDRRDGYIDKNQQPTLERKQILTNCGHSQLYRCYSNSKRCMLCDLLKVI